MREPELQLPEHFHPLADGESFTFACHSGVPCFTECCRELELALSPYDVLRLRRDLGISSSEFLDRYVVIEWQPGDVFPRIYLGMVDDGRASCPFVTDTGCRVYAGRPAACRTYPLGRGAWQDRTGARHACYVLLREPHCRGFAEENEQNITRWIADQGLAEYDAANDLLVPLLQHEKLRHGFRPTAGQRDLYLATLYNLENFRKTNADDGREMTDVELLFAAVNRLIQLFFEERSTIS
jgi:Fe-S-cluster containining protein